MFRNHVKIAGTLTALSPLHLGSGDTRQYDKIRAQTDKGAGEMIEVAAIMRDGAGRPYLPGTSIKGALRARTPGPACVFGQVDDKQDGEGVMGRLWIYGAEHKADGPLADLPYADETGGPANAFAAARTRIDRATGTADDHKLFHAEMVPAGTTFSFRAKWLTNLTGDELEEELAAVKAALAPLVAKEGVALGRGGRHGQGRMLLSGVTATLVPLDGAEKILAGWEELAGPAPTGEIIRLKLTGDGPYISIDSSKRKRGKANEDDPEANKLQPLKSAKDTPALTGTALLGALRARAAWLDGGKDNRDKVYKPGVKLSATERLFGVTGRRGLLAVESIEAASCQTQTFTSVKLDRFSSAPIDGALFSVEAFVDPVFDVALRLETRGEEPVPEEAQALFDRLLEDVEAMGLMLGHGGARGFGWFGVAKTDIPAVTAMRQHENEITYNVIEYTKMDVPAPSEAVVDPPRSAPYRFVPLNQTVVAGEFPVIDQCDDKALDKSPSPLIRRDDNRLSGRLTVTWTAETPFLFGQPGKQKYRAVNVANAPEETILEPVQLGDKYAIPGSSLRGAVRALTEIISFSRLRGDMINGRHRFGLRDFDHGKYKTTLMDANAVKAGWLRLEGDNWIVDTVEWRPVLIEEALNRIPHHPRYDRPTASAWKKTELQKKYEVFADVPLLCRWEPEVRSGTNSQGGPYTTRTARLTPTGRRDGVLVFSGKATSDKKTYEYVLEPPAADSDGSITLTAEEILAFKGAHCKPEGRKEWEPVGSWAYWEPRLRAGDKVPVFFVTDPKGKAGDRSAVRLGLTRLFKLPHLYSLRDVLHRTPAQKERPEGGKKLDITEAIFGFVDDDGDGGKAQGFKGRVSFGFARSVQDVAEIQADSARRATLLAPRPSFGPYYLNHGDGKDHKGYPLDYSNPHAILNGRKRYPARNAAMSGLGEFNEQTPRKTSIESLVRFLPAQTVFTGDIIYRNLTTVELGALLWAITLGHPGGKYRHMLGHARGLGYGQFKAEITDSTGVDIQDCLTAFETRMGEERALGRKLGDCEEIQALLRMADPTFGERCNRSPQPMLKVPGGPKTYLALRKRSTSEGKNMLDPYGAGAPPAPQPSGNPVENRQHNGKKGKKKH